MFSKATKHLIFVLSFLPSIIFKTRQASIGIDFGNEFNKSSLIAPGKLFSIIENKISKRKSPSYLTFLNNSRLYENPALLKSPKTARNSFYHMNKFFGNCKKKLSLKSDAFESLHQDFEIECDDVGMLFGLQDFSFSISEGICRSNYMKIKRQLSDDEGAADSIETNMSKEEMCNFVIRKDKTNELQFRLEEIFGMMLENIRENAEFQAEEHLGFAALTIWDNDLPIRTRKQLIDSMRLAGLKPFALVHENTAAAAKQALNIKADKDMEPFQVVYVNIGSGGIKLSLVEFDKVNAKKKKNLNFNEHNVKLSVLVEKYATNLGSQRIDSCLFNVVVNKFFGQIGEEANDQEVPIKSKRQLMLKLKKTKHVLSVSQEASISLEGFWKSHDLKVKVTNEEVYDECQSLFKETEAFFNKFKEQIIKKDINFDKISQVQLIGGGTRVPGIRKVIEETWRVHDLEVSNHLNGDEAMALGANYVAANLSQNHNLNKIIINDGPGYSIKVKIKFRISQDDSVPFDKEGPLFEKGVSAYGTKKIMSVNGLNADFLLRLQSDDEDNFWTDYKVQGFDRVHKLLKGREVTEAKTNLYFHLDHLGIPKLVKAEMKVTENVWEEVKKQDDKEKKEDKKELKEKSFVIVLESTYLTSRIKTLSDHPEKWKKSVRILDVFKEEEKERKRNLSIKNELETAIYELKEIVESNEEKSRFLTEKEKRDFLIFSKELADFLFDRIPSKEELLDQQQKLRKVRNGFDIRYNEWVNRDLLIDKILGNFNKMQNDIIKIQKANANVPDFKVAEVNEKIERSRQWLLKAKKRFSEQDLFVNPLITKSEIKERNNRMGKLVSKLRKFDFNKKSYSRKLRRNKNLKENLKKDINVDRNEVLKEVTTENLERYFKSFASNVREEGSNENENKNKPDSDL